eukprot:1258246-Karenia_brevis.AAC.1
MELSLDLTQAYAGTNGNMEICYIVNYISCAGETDKICAIQLSATVACTQWRVWRFESLQKYYLYYLYRATDTPKPKN